MRYGKKALVIAAALVICVSVFGLFLTVAGHADHDCSHDDNCEICHIISLCINTIRSTTVFIAALYVAAAVILLTAVVLMLREAATKAESLVSLKVELRN